MYVHSYIYTRIYIYIHIYIVYIYINIVKCMDGYMHCTLLCTSIYDMHCIYISTSRLRLLLLPALTGVNFLSSPLKLNLVLQSKVSRKASIKSDGIWIWGNSTTAILGNQGSVSQHGFVCSSNDLNESHTDYQAS